MHHNVTMGFLFLESIVLMNDIWFSKEMVSLNESCCRYFSLDFTDRLGHDQIKKLISIQQFKPYSRKNAASEEDWMWCLKQADRGASALAYYMDHHLH